MLLFVTQNKFKMRYKKYFIDFVCTLRSFYRHFDSQDKLSLLTFVS